jgi:hypothetical protein
MLGIIGQGLPQLIGAKCYGSEISLGQLREVQRTEEKEFSLDIIDIDMKLKIFFIKQVFYIFILYIAPAYLSMYSHP